MVVMIPVAASIRRSLVWSESTMMTSPPGATATAYGSKSLASVAGPPTALESVLAPDVRAELQAHSSDVRRLLAVILQRGMDDGAFRTDLDPDLDADIVYRTVMALADQAAVVAKVEPFMTRVERAVLSMVGGEPA